MMKKFMTVMAFGSLGVTLLLALGKFSTSVKTAATLDSIEQSETVKNAAIDAARNEMASLIIPNYSHCKMELPTMTNITQVSPLTGKRKVLDSDLQEIGYVTPEAVLVITMQCGETP
jgi:hypothetical protein